MRQIWLTVLFAMSFFNVEPLRPGKMLAYTTLIMLLSTNSHTFETYRKIKNTKFKRLHQVIHPAAPMDHRLHHGCTTGPTAAPTFSMAAPPVGPNEPKTAPNEPTGLGKVRAAPVRQRAAQTAAKIDDQKRSANGCTTAAPRLHQVDHRLHHQNQKLHQSTKGCTSAI